MPRYELVLSRMNTVMKRHPWFERQLAHTPLENDLPVRASNEAIELLDNQREELLSWAVSRWQDEVSARPLKNIHRRTLDDTWRQVVRKLGGDDVCLLGPAHDDLV